MIKGKTITVLIQARVSSTRLPAKHFRKIGDRDLLEWIFTRLGQVQGIDNVVVSTVKEPGSAQYAAYQQKYKYELFEYEGDPCDVAGRHQAASNKYGGDCFVVICGDCPLIDASLIQQGIELLADGNDLAVLGHDSCHEGITIRSRRAMEEIFCCSQTAEQREHFGYKVELRQLASGQMHIPEIQKTKLFRASVDNTADLRFMREVYRWLAEKGLDYTMDNVLALAGEQADLLDINRHVRQKATVFSAQRIAVVTEAGPDKGLGHLSRMIAFAQRLNECYHQGIRFLVNSAAEQKLQIAGYDEGYDYEVVSDAQAMGKALSAYNPAAVLIDLKETTAVESLLSKIPSALKNKTVIIDKVIDSQFCIVPGIQSGEFAAKHQNSSGVFWGEDIVFIPPYLSTLSAQRNPDKNRLVVSFGGTDQDNNTLRVLELLGPEIISEKLNICMLTGFFYKYKEQLHRAADKWPGKIEIVDNSANLYRHFRDAGIGITSYGATFWEMCRLGMPVLMACPGEQYMEQVRSIADRGYGYMIGSTGQLDGSKLIEYVKGRGRLMPPPPIQEDRVVEILLEHIKGEK